MTFFIIILLIILIFSLQSKNYVQNKYHIKDYRPHVYLLYRESPLADYFLETLGNSDSVAIKLLHEKLSANDIAVLRNRYNLRDIYPQLIIMEQGNISIITTGIKTAINDLV